MWLVPSRELCATCGSFSCSIFSVLRGVTVSRSALAVSRGGLDGGSILQWAAVVDRAIGGLIGRVLALSHRSDGHGRILIDGRAQCPRHNLVHGLDPHKLNLPAHGARQVVPIGL